MHELWTSTFDSPIGRLELMASAKGIVMLAFPVKRASKIADWKRRWAGGSRLSEVENPALEEARAQVLAYLQGERHSFSCALELRSTPFQSHVFDALLDIPYGETRSYGEIAAQIGQPGASRAVGNACGANPLPLFIPCHRVLAAGGKLGGFGGGSALKRKLLALERGRL